MSSGRLPQPGDVFEDRSAYRYGRRLKVVSVHGTTYVRLRDIESSRETGIQLRRLVRHFVLVEEA